MTSIAILFLALAITACGNKNGENESQEAAKEEVTEKASEQVNQPIEEETETSVDEQSDFDGSVINTIRKEWKSKTIDVGSGDKTVGISALAFAFCGEYKDYEPNAALYEFLTQPQNYNEEKTGCHVNLDERNGFVSCRAMSQFDLNTDCCYWNRKNGHKLLAVWLTEGHENSENDAKLVLFYDYDPNTDMLTPEPQLTDIVEKNTASFASYSVVLPDKGKNIEVMTFTENDMDSYDTSSFLMVWDGQTFTVKK